MTDPITPLGSPGQPPLPTAAASPAAQAPMNGAASSPVGAASGGARPGTEEELQLLSLSGSRSPAPQEKSPTLEEAAKAFREYLKNLPSDLELSMDRATGTVVCKVVNPVTQEVIRQYPPEEMLAMARKLRALEAKGGKLGMLLDGEL